MAFDTYMKIEGGSLKIEGEATAEGMKDYFEIMSFSWGCSNPTAVGSGSTGLSAGKVSVSSFNVMKKSEKSSPLLFSACCAGAHYDKAIVEMRKATGKAQKTFIKYEFTDVMVESVQWSGSSGGDDTPTESVSFAFAKVKVAYMIQDEKGELKKGPEMTWDLTKVSK